LLPLVRSARVDDFGVRKILLIPSLLWMVADWEGLQCQNREIYIWFVTGWLGGNWRVLVLDGLCGDFFEKAEGAWPSLRSVLLETQGIAGLAMVLRIVLVLK
jgi:hypothetical protein